MVQSFNLPGILGVVKLFRNPRLAVPHQRHRSVADIDFHELKRHGFKGVVFDKDNCLTPPYSDKLHPPLEKNLAVCKKLFGEENVLIFSNSGGSSDDHPEYVRAARIEESVGVRVLKHGTKKPDGVDVMLKHFKMQSGKRSSDGNPHISCPSELVMVGDRVLTDVVFGNSNKMYTILTEIIAPKKNDNYMAAQIREMEKIVLKWLHRRGTKPPDHHLLDKA
eukprot:Nk52_evm2s396 gene=Nk52_evmTU2s396